MANLGEGPFRVITEENFEGQESLLRQVDVSADGTGLWELFFTSRKIEQHHWGPFHSEFTVDKKLSVCLQALAVFHSGF